MRFYKKIRLLLLDDIFVDELLFYFSYSFDHIYRDISSLYPWG